MNGMLCAEARSGAVASTSRPAPLFLPRHEPLLLRRNRRLSRGRVTAAQVELLTRTSGRPKPGTNWRIADEESALPFYTCLDSDILTPTNKFAYYEALRSGLKALRALGINGISVDCYWGIVEGVRPHEYDWSSYKQLFALIRDEGFMAQVCLCFHASSAVPLPAWVVEAGRANPDIYYTDRAGVRSTDYISLGVDEVPALAGRSALECYRDLMASFRAELGPLLGGTIADVLIGLGPDGELKYPAHPRDKRWTFPGIGEFQCYDRYMLAGLRACSYQVQQPPWGLGGPHDAGSYCVWPHQTGFFHQYGNWGSPYGRFFLQWYSEMLARHADSVLRVAREALLLSTATEVASPATPAVTSPSSLILPPTPVSPALPSSAVSGGLPAGGAGSGGYSAVGGGSAAAAVRLHAKLPGVYWWYNTHSHAPELTAGYYNTHTRDGYMPFMAVLARHGVGVRLRSAELRTSETASQACCDPERQLAQQRTVAAALGVSVGLENLSERFDDSALGRLESALFDTSVNQGIELPQVQSLVFNRMCDSMFEPGNWARFKDFVRRVRNRADTLVVPLRRGEGAGPGGGGVAGAAGPMGLMGSVASGGAVEGPGVQGGASGGGGGAAGNGGGGGL